VAVGVLRWPPFFEDGESLSNSWAWSYTKRLVGSINPIEWTLTPVESRSITDAVEDIGTGKPHADLVFGVYDNSYRRLKGLAFIHLPGIGVPLGIIRRKGDAAVSWDAITNMDVHPRAQPLALVMSGEVGHLFLRGNCQLAEQNTFPIHDETIKAEEIAARLCDLLDENPGRTTIFCADRTQCRNVMRALKGPTLRSRARKVEFELVDTDDVAPVYRLGIAVRADADRWIELLRDAQTEELFRNTVGQTARDYATLLARSEDLALLPLEPDISRYVASKFARSCLSHLDRLSEAGQVYVSPDHIANLMREIRTVWLDEGGPHQNADVRPIETRSRRTVA